MSSALCAWWTDRSGKQKRGPQSDPHNGANSGGGSGESVTVTGGVTDQPTVRREK